MGVDVHRAARIATSGDGGAGERPLTNEGYVGPTSKGSPDRGRRSWRASAPVAGHAGIRRGVAGAIDLSMGRACHVITKASRRAGATGLEPATSGVTGRRSNQLNYAPEGRSVYLASQRSEDASSLRASDQS